MAAEKPTWGEERIANELKLKLTIRVSPRTVGKYLRDHSPVRTPGPKQRWLTFVRNHSKVMVACDFFVVITATFRTLYVFVVIEIGSRQILHLNAVGVAARQRFPELLQSPFRRGVRRGDSAAAFVANVSTS